MSLLLLFNGGRRTSLAASIVGAVVLSATPSATMDFTRHASLGGQASVSASPAATMDFTRHAAISGQVTTTITPSATTKYTAPARIVGSITVTITPSATLQSSVVTSQPAPSYIQRIGRRPRQGAKHTIEGEVSCTTELWHSVLAFHKAPVVQAPSARVEVTPPTENRIAPNSSEPEATVRTTERGERSAPIFTDEPRRGYDHGSDTVASPRQDTQREDTPTDEVAQAIEQLLAEIANVPRTGAVVGALSTGSTPAAAMRFTPAPPTPRPSIRSRVAVPVTVEDHRQEQDDMAIIAALYAGMF